MSEIEKTRAGGIATVRIESKSPSPTPRRLWLLYCKLYPTSDLRPTISPTYITRACSEQHTANERASKKIKKGDSHLEDPIRLNGINPQTRILPTPDNLPPISKRARARPQRRVRPEYGAERRRRLETFGRIDMFKNFARHGKVVLYRLLIRCNKENPNFFNFQFSDSLRERKGWESGRTAKKT